METTETPKKTKWYAIGEAAEYLDVGEPTLYRWMREGKITFRKVGDSTRFWQEDLDIAPEEMTSRLEDVAPDVFEEETAWRARLEEEYLTYHRWFREHNMRIPEAEWRSQYVEEVIGLGYTTALGD